MMLDAIRQFFENHIAPEAAVGGRDDDHALRLATAALLMEMTRVDSTVAEEERRAVASAVRARFDLSEEEAAELMRLAEEQAQEAIDYHQFTSLINKKFSLDQKIKVVEQLWRVAYADEKLDKYEEHLVRKVAELLYVPHTEFIAAKHRVLADLA
jgi:uncharacterized tellurite resistance protein B-like protein